MRISQLFFLALITLSCRSTADNHTSHTLHDAPPAYLMESNRFVFYNSFWLNLHHFVHNRVLHQPDAAFAADWVSSLSATQQATVRELVTYYRDNMIEEDLRTSDYMTAFKGWSGQQLDEVAPEGVPVDFQAHFRYLLAFAPLYRKQFWAEHRAANLQVLQGNIGLIRDTEKTFVQQLSAWTQTNWQSEKIRVDITYYAKSYRDLGRDRPFTTLGPTHIVMNATDQEIAGNWYEMLLHEASHNMIKGGTGPISESLAKAAESIGQPVPRSMWHAYLFYLSGRVAQEQLWATGLKEYELYMVRNRVFDRYYPFINKHLPAYLSGDKSLLAANKTLLSAYYAAQGDE